MSRQSELAQLGRVFDTGPLSNRNLIINGAMQIFQRSPITGIGNPSAYTLDRWYLGREGGTEAARFTVTKETLTSSDSPFSTDGHSFAMKLDVTTASGGIGASESHYMMQRIEGQNASQLAYGTSGGKTCTVSFWLKTDTKTGTMSVGLYNTGGSSYIQEISATTTWTKYELQFPANTTTGFTADNSNGLQLMFALSSGSSKQTTAGSWTSGFYNGTSNQADFTDSTSNNIYITGVQLEVGDTATPFEHRSYGDELSRCQRYFYKTQTGGGTGEYRYGILDGATGNYVAAFLDFPTPMRAVPSGTQTENGGFYYNTGSGQTSFTPSGGTDDTLGLTETYGRIRQANITNSPGSSDSQKLGQWYCAGEFDAEL